MSKGIVVNVGNVRLLSLLVSASKSSINTEIQWGSNLKKMKRGAK